MSKNSLFDNENVYEIKSYDERQNMLSYERRDGFWQKWTYDEHDNVSTHENSHDESYEYIRTYYENGSVKTKTYKDSSGGFLYSKYDENEMS